MGLFGKKKKTPDPKQWSDVRWGTSSPVMVRLSSGAGRFRAFGRFSCEISDEALLKENGCDAASDESLDRFTGFISGTVAGVFADELGVLSRDMSEEELLDSAVELSEAMKRSASGILGEKGVSLVELSVERLLKS